jgi:type IV secretion system protein TrbL
MQWDAQDESNTIFFMTYVISIIFSAGAFAELAYIDPATNQSVLDQVIQNVC